MPVGILMISMHLPGCKSLKEKRSRIRPIIHQIRKKFNVSVAETAQQDIWQNTVLGCAIISNERTHIEQSFQNILAYIQQHWPDELVQDEEVDIL